MWEKFLNGLASEGGNILVLLILVLILGLFVGLKYPDADKYLYIVVGALLQAMRGLTNPPKQ